MCKALTENRLIMHNRKKQMKVKAQTISFIKFVFLNWLMRAKLRFKLYTVSYHAPLADITTGSMPLSFYIIYFDVSVDRLVNVD